MKKAIFHFPTDGKPVDCKQIKTGHINETYVVTTDTGAQYTLQCINSYVFPNVDAIMSNVSKISEYLRKNENGQMAMIRYINTLDGQNYYSDGVGGCWRMYRFVDNSLCLHRPETPEDFYECAMAFGRFQYALNGFPAEELEETIVGFHDTPNRYRQFREAVEADPVGRAAEAGPELAFALRREERACRLHRMRESGELPVRVTHNDTKINNVLLDEDTRKAICVIDLDTVMPGLAVFDFGDAIRFGASTADEDETDLSKVSLDMELFRVFVRGFFEACPSLTAEEIEAMPMGAYTMTLECGLRFLTDYINGDKYFSIDREKQNLDRCRTQFKLIESMEANWKAMEQIVREETAGKQIP